MPTTYYVGIGGNDGNNGTSWATRKLTLNGAENVPVAAGDTVYVGPGTYREMLTVDVSGGAGTAISYIGDYTGASTDGVGGVVRITGSDNDQSATRANCILASGKNYRTFRGFTFDTTTDNLVFLTSGTYWTIDECYFCNGSAGTSGIYSDGASQLAIAISNCYFNTGSSSGARQVRFVHSSTVDNVGHTVSSCIFDGAFIGVDTQRVGGITINGCLFTQNGRGVFVETALTAGQLVTVNNSIFSGCNVAMNATTTAEFSENYNSIFRCTTARANVNTGANSNTYAFLPDTRWFHEATNSGRFATPFDMASYCALVDVAGTSPTTTDMRGTAVQGTQREWGALEYDSTLLIESAAGGGGVMNRDKRGGKQ
jgi:hypothetical protein